MCSATKPPAPIILHGNNFDTNRGCQALRLTTQAILDRYLPAHPRLHANIFCNEDPQFYEQEPDPKSAGQIWETHHRGGPFFYGWGAGVLAARLFGRFPRMRVHRCLDHASALLLLGGDNLSFDYGFLATLLFFSPLQAALQRNTPTVIWGASIGPFSSRPKWEKRFAKLLHQVDLITVREPLTQQYLAKLGIAHNVERVVDPAFLLPPEPTELPSHISHALAQGAIGINLAPIMTRYNRSSSRKWLDTCCRMLSEVRQQVRVPLLLIPHVMMSPRTFPDNDDYQFMKAILARLSPSHREGIHLYDARRHTSKQIKWVISQLRVFAASRLHASIAGLSSGVPTFSVGYGVKSEGLHRDIFGHTEWIADTSEINPKEFANRLLRLFHQEVEVRHCLQSVLPDYSEMAWRNGAVMRDNLNRRRACPQETCL